MKVLHGYFRELRQLKKLAETCMYPKKVYFEELAAFQLRWADMLRVDANFLKRLALENKRLTGIAKEK